MALAKEGYSSAIQGTSKVNVAVDSDGYLTTATSGTAAGTKKFQISKVAAENSLVDNTDVLGFFIELANGVADSNTNTMNVTWEV